MKLKALLEGAGAGILLLLPYLYDNLSLSRLYNVYHLLLPSNSVARGLLIDLFVVCFSCSVIFFLLDRYVPQRECAVDAIVFGTLVWRTISDLLLIFEKQGSTFPHWKYLSKPILFIFIVSLFLLRRVRKSWYCPVALTVQRWLFLIGFCILWILPLLLHVGFANQPNDASFMRQPVPSKPAGVQNRIVWILFDELSYDQTFDHRQAGIELPNLDRIHKESVVFAKIQPVGYYTDRIIPSLLIGRPLTDIRSSSDGRLSILPSDTRRWEHFDPEETLFAQAKKLGWSSGVAGWHNPYCRILSGILDDCFWTPEVPITEFSGRKSSLENALAPFYQTASQFGKIAPGFPSPVQTHIHTEEDVIPEAIRLVHDERIRFVFLHLPVPHPPGIYNRNNHQIRQGGSYLDNLVFADDLLGILLRELDSTASNQQTTLIISSDHSWRIPLWKSSPFWTEEDDRASGGRFDSRPVLMIHFPGQQNTILQTQKIPELALHAILLRMLQEQGMHQDLPWISH
jgi:Sulfatase